MNAMKCPFALMCLCCVFIGCDSKDNARNSTGADLIEKLNDEDSTVRMSAVEEFGKMGAEAIPFIPKVMDVFAGEDENLKWVLTATVGQLGPAAMPELDEFLKDERPEIRLWTVRALGEIGPEATEELVTALTDAEEQVRLEAAKWIARIATPECERIVPSLIVALDNENWLVQKFAAEALGKIGPAAKPALSAITSLLEDEHPQVSGMAGNVLRNIGPDAIPFLRDGLKSPQPQAQMLAARALCSVEMASDPDRVVPALVEALEHDHPAIRGLAVEALGTVDVGEEVVLPHLRKVTGDGSIDVRFAAMKSIAKIASSPVPLLVYAWKHDSDYEWRSDLKFMSVSVCSGIGGRVVPDLLQTLKSEDEEERQWATQVLVQIGSEAVPQLTRVAEQADTPESYRSLVQGVLNEIEYRNSGEPQP